MDYIASIRGIEEFVAQAMGLGDFERYECGVAGMHILYLKSPLSDEEYGVLMGAEMARWEMMHDVLKPKRADAKLYQMILMVDRQILPRVGALVRGPYTEVGAEMSRQVHRLMYTYFMIAHGRKEVDATKDEMLEAMEWPMSGIALLSEVGV